MKRTNLLTLIATLVLVLTAPSMMNAQEEGTDEKKKKSNNQEEFINTESSGDYDYDGRTEIRLPVMPSYAQNDSVSYLSGKSKRIRQQTAFNNREYYYPANPKNQWEIGVNVGSNLINGDVRSELLPWKSWGAGLHVRKALGYSTSIRVKYWFSQSQGQEADARINLTFNPALNGGTTLNDDVNYFNNPDLALGGSLNALNERNMNNIYWHNYKTTMHSLSGQLVFTVGGQQFHKEKSRWNLNVWGGLGGVLNNVKTDALDANGEEYDYSTAANLYFNNADASDVLDEIANVRDDEFESLAKRAGNNLFGDHMFSPTGNLGAGIAYRIGNKINLALESTFVFVGHDVLDGMRYHDDNTLTNENDTYIYNSIGLNFNLGKKELEPLYWLNPTDYAYKQIGEMDPEKAIDDFVKDDDEDGVPNRLDQEPETPEGCPVDVKGVALDSDKDGCIDCLDQEPFSPPGYPIDENCVAIVPCCAEGMNTGYNCERIELPSIHFTKDKYYIDPEFYSHLHQIGERMQMCPNLTLVASGLSDDFRDPKYREQISWNRVNKSVDYLVEKYGISRDRFIVEFGASENKGSSTELERKVEFRFAEEGESGDSNPPSPHPGLKAGSDR